jgi:apolipoprotein N-acyltransferase
VVYGAKQIERFNSAIGIDPSGKVVMRYAKMHLVMFGEYIPLGPVLGWLGRSFGFVGINAGTQPEVLQVKQTKVAPNICFETMIPRLIGWQVRTLRRQQREPQLLVNLTNDGWFMGTSMLDHHLASSIICAVENRKPILVAANTGLTAQIDGSGRLLQCTQPLKTEWLLAQPRADGRWGLVQLWGYPLSCLCGMACLMAAIVAIRLGKSAD